MELRIQAMRVEVDQELILKMESKLKQLESQLSKVKTKIEVYLKTSQFGNLKKKVVEIIVNIAGKSLMFKESGPDFEVAFNLVYQTLKRQIVREKEKLQEKH
ncbi:MAG: HPF/RaiA family ribosome-associated protein [Saprospiraceae bacterium]|nr:HPF/RaiA family ribosome-associated protein [Saprospiraceae bacterium]